MDDDASHLETIRDLLQQADADSLARFLAELTPSQVVHVVSRLAEDERLRLLEVLPREKGAWLVLSLPLAIAGDMLRDLEPTRAAAILDLLPSDDQADYLASLGEPQAATVLAAMAPAEARDVERLSHFAADTAGGLMATEFLAYPASATVADVASDLRTRAHEYAQYPAQYVYVLSNEGRLQGVVRLRDLLFHRDQELLGDLSLCTPQAVTADADLHTLQDFFESHRFFVAPVVDSENRLIGVVSREDFDEAYADQAAQTLLRFGGIVIGEEFRSMPLSERIGGRLAWLAITMLLSFLAASVVGLFQGTLSQLIALAVFLPVISGMSGNAGNQAIAVSMRELSLGLVKPQEIGWVLAKEASVGLINGVVIGLGLICVAWFWKGDIRLGLVVGAAQLLSIVLAACVGGVVPLVLKRRGFDPAIASAPLLTTITDAAGFFLTLGLARVWLTH